MDFFNDHKIIFLLIGGLLLFVVYSMVSVIINKLNNVIKGKTTVFAWIPFTNVYLIGKLVANKIIGILLVILLLYGVIISVDIPGLEVLQKFKLPSQYVVPYFALYSLMIFLLVVAGKSKFNKIIREGTGKDEMSTFIAKDFDDNEPNIVVNNNTTVRETEEGINDNFQYNSTSLNNLKDLNKKEDKNP